MIEIKTKLRRWGNSLGVVVPLSSLKNNGELKENEEVTVFITKQQPNLKKLFGSWKLKESTDKIMKEIDEELDSEW